MIRAPKLDMPQYKVFIMEKLVKGTCKVLYSSKEKQATGTLITKRLTFDSSFQYTMASVPFDIATRDGYLHRSKKVSFLI